MKTKQYGFLLLLLLLIGCSPKNEEQLKEHVDTDQSGEVVDSVSNTRKDIVTRETTEDLEPLPLPQPVMLRLEQHYPGWREPTLLEEAKQKAKDFDLGPYTVRGDFNGDTEQDYALQIQHDNQVIILAFIRNAGDWQVQELKKDILFNDRGVLKSPYYLFLAEAGTELYDQETKQRFELERDAVSVGLDSNYTVYVFENGRFRSYLTTF